MIVDVKSREELNKLTPILKKFYSILPYKKNYDNLECNWVDRWEKLIDSGVGGIFGMKENNKFIGAIGYVLHPSLEDGEPCCTETFWYVDEKFRGKGLKLLLKLQKFAKNEGVKRLIMIHLENSMPEKLRKLYSRMEFNHIESVYMKEL